MMLLIRGELSDEELTIEVDLLLEQQHGTIQRGRR